MPPGSTVITGVPSATATGTINMGGTPGGTVGLGPLDIINGVDASDRALSSPLASLSTSQGQHSFRPTQGQGTSSSSLSSSSSNSGLSSPLARQLNFDFAPGNTLGSSGANVIVGTPIVGSSYGGGMGYSPYMTAPIGLGYGTGYGSSNNGAMGSGYGSMGFGYPGSYGFRSSPKRYSSSNNNNGNHDNYSTNSSPSSYRPPYGAISNSPTARQASMSNSQSFPSSSSFSSSSSNLDTSNFN